MKNRDKTISKFTQITSLLITIFLICIIAINRDKQVFGISIEEKGKNNNITFSNGNTIVNTSNIVSDIKGFAGATHLEIYINSNGIISKIRPLKNSESPRFFNTLEKNGLYAEWVGLTPQEALEKQVDAISGATYSSNAVIKTFNSAMEYVINNKIVSFYDITEFFSIKNIIAILIILFSITLPLFTKNRIIRYLQLIINILILGVWCGTFLSLSMIVNFTSNGFNNIDIIIPLLLIIVAFIYPLFGKKQYYCTWVCPYGASQEIINSISPFKINISNKTNKILKIVQKILWIIIMFIMCSGLYFDIMDYEAFTIFMYNQAYTPALIIGFTFLVLSLFVKRPYCKYICPTGYLIRFAERSNYKINNK